MASGADLLERMRRSPHGFSPKDFERMLTHYGFKRKEGRSHTTYRHELSEPGRVVIVPRHRSILAHVARSAVASVDSVIDQED